MKDKLVLIDGNSMMNRAFYGIMRTSIMKTRDGQYTNAIYGFLNILFKILEEQPKYLVVSFDISRPKERLELYSEYKAGRNKTPEELKSQFPIIKQILKDMNIDIVEKEEVEADDIIGTLSRYGEANGLEVEIVSGDRDTFQLITEDVKVKMPRTKAGQTQIFEYGKDEIQNEYGLTPLQLIDVKGLQGDSSDNIPGVPGVGEKTALKLIQQYGSIENLYDKISKNEDDLKGKMREKIVDNKDLAFMSKKLGTINLNIPIDHNLENYKVEEWDKQKVYDDFKKLNLNRFIQRFHLDEGTKPAEEVSSKRNVEIICVDGNVQDNSNAFEFVNGFVDGKNFSLFYDIQTKPVEDVDLVIQEKIEKISIADVGKSVVYVLDFESNLDILKEILENPKVEKYSYDMSKQYILFKQSNIDIENMYFDVKIASYILDPTDQRLSLQDIAKRFLDDDIEVQVEEKQMSLFETPITDDGGKNSEKENKQLGNNVFAIVDLITVLKQKLEEIESTELFRKIEMPTVEVLANMQWNGIYVDKKELEEYGIKLSEHIDVLKQQIYSIAGEEFNINSPKQLGVILFEKLGLPVVKKNKTGYSTDTKVLAKLKGKHEIISLIEEYRAYSKLYSTYIEGLIPYIKPKTGKIHSTFSQTVTATGRISSLEPNLQNIPTRTELGKQLRKVFKPGQGNRFIDGDYSQIELRVLADISEDETMIHSFENGLDIHKMAASKVYHVPLDEVTDSLRSSAKAVNFGIVYGISDFGLSESLNIRVKEAKQLIEQYLEQYDGIKRYLDNVVEQAKKDGYTKTLFNRRRYINELSSSNVIVQNFGKRIAMNSPIQGTAADIMKIAMINVFNLIKKEKMDAKIVLQIHDEMIIQVPQDKAEQYLPQIQEQMQNAVKLKVPLTVNMEVADNWYDCK